MLTKTIRIKVSLLAYTCYERRAGTNQIMSGQWEMVHTRERSWRAGKDPGEQWIYSFKKETLWVGLKRLFSTLGFQELKGFPRSSVVLMEEESNLDTS